MAALRAASLRTESGIWFFTKRFGTGFGLGVGLISRVSGGSCCCFAASMEVIMGILFMIKLLPLSEFCRVL